jgi:hypothetical protein
MGVLKSLGVAELSSLSSLSFQGLVNNTGIDWFMPWPPQALHAVAKSFLGKSQLSGVYTVGLRKKFALTFLTLTLVP